MFKNSHNEYFFKFMIVELTVSMVARQMSPSQNVPILIKSSSPEVKTSPSRIAYIFLFSPNEYS